MFVGLPAKVGLKVQPAEEILVDRSIRYICKGCRHQVEAYRLSIYVTRQAFGSTERRRP